MTTGRRLACFLAALVLARIILAPTLVFSQTAESRAFSALPDWSGAWQRIDGTIFDPATAEPSGGSVFQPPVREHPPYNAEWEAKYRENLELFLAGRLPDPLTYCLPPGFPRTMVLPGAIEFVLRPEQIWILNEDGPNISRIYTDGRSLPEPNEYWPTYGGESVGHWEGDTLVFETIGLKGDGDAVLDRTGATLSIEARIVTRMRKTDDGLLEARMVIEDPVALTKPWHVTRRFERLPEGSKLYDVVCPENNRNPTDASGRTLTLDAGGNVLDKID